MHPCMAQCGGNPSRYAAIKPTERDLKVVADRAGNNWSHLLTSLDIPWATIQRMRAESPTDLWEACMKGLVLWLKEGASDSSEPVTFGTLFAALKESGMTECVSLLVDRLDERPTHEDEDEDLSTPTSDDRKIAMLSFLFFFVGVLLQLFGKPGQNEVFRSDLVIPGKHHSVKMPNLLIPTYRTTPVTIGRDVYLVGGLTGDAKTGQLVQVYNMDSGDCQILPPSPQSYSTAVAIDGTLVLIGGMDSSTYKPTNMMSTWMAAEERWTQSLPPMNMKRYRPSVLLLNNHLFVFGGKGEDWKTRLDSFEVLDLNTKQWREGRGGLPQPLSSPQLGVFRNYVLLYGGLISAGTTRKCYSVPVKILVDSVTNPLSQPIHWTPVQDALYDDSTLLTTSQDAVLIGGDSRDGQATRAIHRFSSSGSWKVIGELSEPRLGPTVVAVSDRSFLVLSGYSDPKNASSSLLKSVELISY